MWSHSPNSVNNKVINGSVSPHRRQNRPESGRRESRVTLFCTRTGADFMLQIQDPQKKYKPGRKCGAIIPDPNHRDNYKACVGGGLILQNIWFLCRILEFCCSKLFHVFFVFVSLNIFSFSEIHWRICFYIKQTEPHLASLLVFSWAFCLVFLCVFHTNHLLFTFQIS